MRSVIVPVLVALVTSACGPKYDPPLGTGYEYVNQDPRVEYVGRDACKDCHKENYETYVASEMGRSFKKATLSNSDANFADVTPLFDSQNNMFYLPFNRGEELFIMEFRTVGEDTTHKRIEKIDYIVGSGHHTNSHIMDVNGYLFQMPLTWYVQDGRWDLPPGFVDGNRRFDRPIEVECMSCHNGQPEHVANSGNRYRQVPEGIGCERCHGPGKYHVDEMEAGRLVDTTRFIDYSIVTPGRLPADQQFDLCQRCHLQGTAYTVAPSSFLDFRPGTALGDVIKVFQPRYADSLDQFIMASHPDRLRMSDCFRVAREADSGYEPMTCVMCHNPHVGIDSTATTDLYNTVCQNCHSVDRSNLCSEDVEVRAAANDDCWSCHMPISSSKDIPHVTITDHNIRIPEPVRSRSSSDAAEFYQLASLTDANPSARVMAEGYLTHYEQFEHRPYFLDSAAVFMDRALTQHSEVVLVRPLVRLWFLQGEYEKAADLGRRITADSLSDAWTLYRIGESAAKIGNVRQSIRFFERAVAEAPEHLQFRNKLATAYTADRQLPRATELFDALLKDHPKFADAYNNRGFARVLLGDLENAQVDFEKALSLNPDLEPALANLASLFANTNRLDRSRKYLERLIEMDPDNQNYRRLLDIIDSPAEEGISDRQ
ncbi:MAG: tetratricopeptide repeat protein [Rhodothermales bacterium]|nr:tetratricopeptide repeat protein [Rhodothermales bacterium]